MSNRTTGWRWQGAKMKKKGTKMKYTEAVLGLPPRDIPYAEAEAKDWVERLEAPGMNKFYKAEKSKGE